MPRITTGSRWDPSVGHIVLCHQDFGYCGGGVVFGENEGDYVIAAIRGWDMGMVKEMMVSVEWLGRWCWYLVPQIYDCSHCPVGTLQTAFLFLL